MRRRRTGWLLSSTLLCSAVLLGLGLVGPCLTVVPRAGELTGWLRLLRPGELEPTTYSILGGIAALWRGGEPGLAAVLLAFSVVFPTLKLGAMGWGVAAVWMGQRPHAVVRWAGHLGKFSMLDVVVLGLLVLAVQALPGGSEAELGWGVWAFAASVGLGLVGSVMLATTSR
ncbi:MAG: paraquat-inducible protein A [Planctomycetota bacterium]